MGFVYYTYVTVYSNAATKLEEKERGEGIEEDSFMLPFFMILNILWPLSLLWAIYRDYSEEKEED